MHDGEVTELVGGERQVTGLAIRPDGSGLRKLTNAPVHADLASLPHRRLPALLCYRRSDMALDVASLPALAADYAHRTPQDILDLAFREYGSDLAISFSGAEDVVLMPKDGGNDR